MFTHNNLIVYKHSVIMIWRFLLKAYCRHNRTVLKERINVLKINSKKALMLKKTFTLIPIRQNKSA